MSTVSTPKSVDEKPSARRMMNPVNLYFNYNSIDDESTCLILECRRRIPGKHSGNLLKHIKRHHKDKLDVIEKEKETFNTYEKMRKRKIGLNDVQMTGGKLKNLCVRMVTEHGRPFALMDDEAFQEIVNPYIQAMPARDRFVVSSASITNLIPSYSKKVRSAISKDLQGRLISVKIDATTKGSRTFLGVNVQYINRGMLELCTLAVKEMTTRHTGKNIKTELMDILQEYNIHVENVLTLTSDTGANMLKAAELLQDVQEVAAENLIEEWFPYFEIDCGDFRLQSIRCAAHTLQLAVDHAIKNTPGLKELLDEVRTVARNFRTPSIHRRLKKNSLTLPVLDVVTRWSSTYDMMQSIRRLKDFIVDYENENEQEGSDKENEVGRRKELALTSEQWDALDSAIAALEPAKVATKCLQEEKMVLSDIYGIWLECKLKIASLDSELAKNLKENMEERENRRVNRKGEEKLPPLLQYPGFLGAIYLDPRYFSVLSTEQQQCAKEYLVKVWARLEALKLRTYPKEILQSSIDGNQTNTNDENDDNDDDDAVSEYLKARDAERLVEPKNNRILSLLQQYYHQTKRMSRKCNVLQYWESQRYLQPELTAMATVVLASVERLFSSLRYVLSPLRYNMAPDMVDDVLVIRNNAEYLKKCEIAPDDLFLAMSESSSILSADDSC